MDLEKLKSISIIAMCFSIAGTVLIGVGFVLSQILGRSGID